MKKEFSTSWRGSKLPRKQRKYVAKAPLHLRAKMISAHLSKDLRKKYGRRAFQIRKGDSVKIMKGEHKGKTGKISEIDLTKLRVAIEGVQLTKKDGSKVNVYFNASNLMLTEMNLEDKQRLKSITKKNKTESKK